VEVPELHRLVLDSLEQVIVVLAGDLGRVLFKNRAAAQLFEGPLPPAILDAVGSYVASRDDQRKRPPPLRVELDERAFYLRVIAGLGDAAFEIVLLNEEVLRDADAFKLLNARHGVSRREYQVLSALRLGKTNRQIAADLGLAEGTINVYVHQLLERFDVPNRTRLVKVVEEALANRL
jgi:DNA-binding CsgD family transcriptional regulator